MIKFITSGVAASLCCGAVLFYQTLLKQEEIVHLLWTISITIVEAVPLHQNRVCRIA